MWGAARRTNLNPRSPGKGCEYAVRFVPSPPPSIHAVTVSALPASSHVIAAPSRLLVISHEMVRSGEQPTGARVRSMTGVWDRPPQSTMALVLPWASPVLPASKLTLTA